MGSISCPWTTILVHGLPFGVRTPTIKPVKRFSKAVLGKRLRSHLRCIKKLFFKRNEGESALIAKLQFGSILLYSVTENSLAVDESGYSKAEDSIQIHHKTNVKKASYLRQVFQFRHFS